MISVYQKLKTFWWQGIKSLHPRLYAVAFRYRMYIKYIISGGTAAMVDLGLLAFFIEVFRFHYLVAATLAFVVAFFVSFILQKFWTFGHSTMDDVYAQAGTYLGIALSNLLINAGLMYLFVDTFGLRYLFSQILAGGLIALFSFVLYRRFVFTRSAEHLEHI